VQISTNQSIKLVLLVGCVNLFNVLLEAKILQRGRLRKMLEFCTSLNPNLFTQKIFLGKVSNTVILQQYRQLEAAIILLSRETKHQ
jgi:hypothetical protein